MAVVISVTANDRGKSCFKGRLVKVEDDATLSSVLTLVCPELEPGVVSVSSSSSDAEHRMHP